MELQINHRGLDIAESVEFFLKQAQISLSETRLDDFFEIIDSIVKEIEVGGKELDIENPEYSLANARVLMCGANLRVLMVICKCMVSKKVDLAHLLDIREKVVRDIISAKEHLKVAKITELNQAVSIAEEKLTGILDRYYNA